MSARCASPFRARAAGFILRTQRRRSPPLRRASPHPWLRRVW